MTATARPLRFRRLPSADVASRRVPVAVTVLSRTLGLEGSGSNAELLGSI